MIIAIKDKDRVVVAYSNNDILEKMEEKDSVDKENVAMRVLDNGTVFGFVKPGCRTDMFIYDDEFLSGDITPKYILREVIPYMKKKMADNNKPYTEKKGMNNAMIICTPDRIFEIGNRLTLLEKESFACVSWNYEEVLISVLDATEGLSPRERICKTLDFVSKKYRANFYPCVITDTKSKKFEVIANSNVILSEFSNCEDKLERCNDGM